MSNNDRNWFVKIIETEKSHPKSTRVFPQNSPLENDSFTDEQIDDYFMISDRLEYLRFIKSHKNELSKESFLWLYEDLPFCVNKEYRVTYEDLEKREKEYA